VSRATQCPYESPSSGRERRLTLRSSRLAPAWHLAREALVLIIRLAGQAPHRRSRLSSNVGPHWEPHALFGALGLHCFRARQRRRVLPRNIAQSQAHAGASGRRAAPGGQFAEALRAASATLLAYRTSRLRCSPSVVRLPLSGRACLFVAAEVQLAPKLCALSSHPSSLGWPRSSLPSQARCRQRRRQSFLLRCARLPNPSRTAPDAAQPFARADSHRQAAWPAHRPVSLSVARAKRLTGVCRSAQTLGSSG